ncbi:unnamed protein product [Prunus armeniaca]
MASGHKSNPTWAYSENSKNLISLQVKNSRNVRKRKSYDGDGQAEREFLVLVVKLIKSRLVGGAKPKM